MTQREYLDQMINNINSIKVAIELQSKFLCYLSDNLKKLENGEKLRPSSDGNALVGNNKKKKAKD